MALVLNFSGHQLTKGVRASTAVLVGSEIEVRELSRQLNLDHLADDVEQLVRSASLPPEVWQEQEILVMPPTLGVVAAVLCAHLHGLTGSFPRLLWLRLDPGTGTYTLPTILDLSAVRNRGRQLRFEG